MHNIEEIINKINESMEKLDILSTTKMMEEHMFQINQRRQQLIVAARKLFDSIKQKQELGLPPLTRTEVSILYKINIYATEFDIRGVRAVIKEHPELWVRDDIEHYFNEDAKILLQGMNVIPKIQQKQTPLSS